MARTKDDTGVSWEAVSAAVGLLTAQRAASGDSRTDILGDVPPGQVITALQVVACGLMDVLFPGDQGGCFLEFLGLAALEQAAKRPGAAQ